MRWTQRSRSRSRWGKRIRRHHHKMKRTEPSKWRDTFRSYAHCFLQFKEECKVLVEKKNREIKELTASLKKAKKLAHVFLEELNYHGISITIN